MVSAWAARTAMLLLCALPAGVATSRALGAKSLRGRAKFAKPDWGYYHKTDETYALIETYASKCPELTAKRVSDTTDATYTVENSMVVTATASGSTEVKLPMMMVFGEHARELISSEIALRLVAMLCAPAVVASGGWAATDVNHDTRLLATVTDFHRKALSGLAQYDLRVENVSALLRRLYFKFLPLENLNGRRMVEEKDMLCHRMNGRHVDINRNYDNHFGVHAPEYLKSEEYEGTAAASEPETRITRDIAAVLRPVVFVSVHSGIRELYLPYFLRADQQYDWKKEQTTEPAINAVMTTINKKFCSCGTGSVAKIGGYRGFGTTTDYMYEKQKAKYVYTWEVFGDLKAHNDDCFRMFNPVTESEYEDNVNRWAAATLTLAAEVIHRELEVDAFAEQPSPASMASTTAPAPPSPPSNPTGQVKKSPSVGSSVVQPGPHAVLMSRPDHPAHAGSMRSVSEWMAHVGMLGRIATVAIVLLATYALLRAMRMLARACISS